MKPMSLSKLLEEARTLSDAARDAHVERLESAEVTALDRRLLDLLESAPRPVSSRRLAGPLLRTASEVESRLRMLQERAWVRQVAPKGSGPAAFELAALGRRRLASLRQCEREFETALESALDADEVRAAISLLRTVRIRLQGGDQPRRRARGRDVEATGDFERPRRGFSAAAAGAVSA